MREVVLTVVTLGYQDYGFTSPSEAVKLVDLIGRATKLQATQFREWDTDAQCTRYSNEYMFAEGVQECKIVANRTVKLCSKQEYQDLLPRCANCNRPDTYHEFHEVDGLHLPFCNVKCRNDYAERVRNAQTQPEEL